MTTNAFTPIEPSDQTLRHRQEAEIKERVFLYGFWEELRLMQSSVYPDRSPAYATHTDFSPGISEMMQPLSTPPDISRKFPNGLEDLQRLYYWDDAERVTRIVASTLSDKALPDRFMNYQSLRAIGAGIENVFNMQKWVGFLREKLRCRGVDLETFAIVNKDPMVHVEWFRQEMHLRVNKSFKLADPNNERVHARATGKILFRGVLRNSDFVSKNLNITNGMRKTVPTEVTEYTKTCHFFGSSEVYGTDLKDSDTIPSRYAQMNDNKTERVLNHGMGGVNFIDVVECMLTTQFASGDKAILALPFCCAAFSDHPVRLDRRNFFDQSHVSPCGADRVARELTTHASRTNVAGAKISAQDIEMGERLVSVYRNVLMRVEVAEYVSEEVKEYSTYLKANKFGDSFEGAIIGSVAVNCNPLTNGHLSLIEFALTKVDYLYVLVIEEDKSTVKFSDRFEMVRLACESYANVKVLRGGQFVCTEYIAPEYFEKDTIEVEQPDFLMESFYFGNFIAPALAITEIFLGEEPTCEITRRYNDHMISAMPEHGIVLTIVPRVLDGVGNPISASTVRQYIKDGHWDDVADLVPPSSLTYLRENVVL